MQGEGKFKLDPERKLFSLLYAHKATPPDFHLLLLIDRICGSTPSA